MAGRRHRHINPDEVWELAKAGATQLDMARFFGVSLRTMTRRLALTKYAHVYESGQGALDVSLRQKQVELALAGDKTMLIWLGKQRLGQSDRVQHSGTGPSGSIELNVSAIQLLTGRITSLAARVRETASPQHVNGSASGKLAL